MASTAVRLGELVATFALAQDSSFGQPLESQLRSCVLAMWCADEARFDPQLRATTYWVALLRYLGCTGHAHEVATVFGDEIAIRARTLVHDAADPAEVMRDAVAFATAGRPAAEHDEIERTLQEGVHAWAVHNFASGCEVGDMLAERLGMGDDVREALGFTFERWNGNGYPSGAGGEDIPVAMRLVHLTHDMEAVARLFSPERALAAATERRGRTYDPALADLFTTHGSQWLARLDKLDPWDAVLDLEPRPHRLLEGAELDDALTVVADFVDLKSPYLAGSSRRCAQLAAEAAGLMGVAPEERTRLRRAALVRDLGLTSVPNSILDKTGPLTRSEADRFELHPMLTEQMLRRSPGLVALNPVAAAHHERADGSGYHKGLGSAACHPCTGVLVAADAYVTLTTDRADRPAVSGALAAAGLRRQAADGLLDPPSTEAVLSAAGHEGPGGRRGHRAVHPGGLTGREVDVLRLAARGLTTKEIADQLTISPKTADHHIQHVYGKLQLSTRAAAALWAMEHSLVP